MNVRDIADAVLYEGYMLYPYRPSSVKNRQRWTFGGLYPEGFSGDPSSMQAQVLIEGRPEVDVTVRFLHLLERADGIQEAMPREVGAGPFEFPAAIYDGGRRQEAISGLVERETERVGANLHKVTVRVTNRTPFESASQMSRDQASMFALVSTHAVLYARAGEFVSLMDPSDAYREAAAGCVNTGVWPVLVGEPGSRDCMLASPIILYDYPEIAPESAGDLFDGTEIDEILTLRILTLTDDEKNEMRNADDHTRRLLERTESLSPEQMMKLHGALRNPHEAGLDHV